MMTASSSAPLRAHVDVALGARAYRVEIGQGLLAGAGALIAPLLARKQVCIITDDNVAATHLPTLQAGLTAAGITSAALALPPGEGTKNMAELTTTVEWMLERKVERDDLIIALGGGVIGDLAGFAAAIMRRGVGFVQIPTSLLAQVDSSVGGKTGVNASQGKNLIGAFHQPRLVLADIDVLDTLPPRQFLSGYAEVVKYGLLGDADFFAWLEVNGPALKAGDAGARLHAVHRSVEMKAAIVARDETEQGERALLNLGHTFGHALEAATGYSDRLTHGEGVAIGCQLAFDVSSRLGFCTQEAPSRVAAHFAAMGLRHALKDVPGDLPDADGLMNLMGQDKKVKAGKLTFILARAIGDAFVTQDADLAVVRTALVDGLASRG
ncbi:MAG: 3-dehydroquinate synthase [Paracoccaceae bacterium]|jgi:3-dehydroquinate synthase